MLGTTPTRVPMRFVWTPTVKALAMPASLPPTSDLPHQDALAIPELFNPDSTFNPPAIDGPASGESNTPSSEMAASEPQSEYVEVEIVAQDHDTSEAPIAIATDRQSQFIGPVLERRTQVGWTPALPYDLCYDTRTNSRAVRVQVDSTAEITSSLTVFKIDAADIAKLARITNLKSRGALHLIIEVGAAQLTCIATTLKKDFTIACTVPLRDTISNRSFAFQIDIELLTRLGDRFDGPMTFTFDTEDDTLHWRADQREGSFLKAVKSTEPRDSGEIQLAPLATLPAATLAEAVGYASMFASQAVRERSRYDGLRIGGGFAASSCLAAGVRYASTAIPDGLDIVVPLRNAANLKTVLAKLSGPVDIVNTDASVFLKTEDTTISWTRDGDWPADLERIFQLPIKSSVTFQTERLMSATLALSIAMKQAEIRIEQDDNGLGRLVLAGQSISATGSSPISPWSQISDLPTDIWTFSLDVANLLSALGAVKTDQVTLDFLDRGIYVRSRASGYHTTALLAGKQLS